MIAVFGRLALMSGLVWLLSACAAQSSDSVYSVALSCISVTLMVGQRSTCTAIAKDSSGNAVSPQPTYSFTSSNSAVVSILSSGVMTAMTAGSVQIVASTNPPVPAKSSLPVTVQVRSACGNSDK